MKLNKRYELKVFFDSSDENA